MSTLGRAANRRGLRHPPSRRLNRLQLNAFVLFDCLTNMQAILNNRMIGKRFKPPFAQTAQKACATCP